VINIAFLLSNYSSVLREVILPYIQDNLPVQKITLNQFKKSVDSQVMNNNFHVPLRTGRHGGITSLANDGNNLNATNGATFGRGSVAVKTHTGAFNISKLAIEASAGDKLAIKGAFMAQADSLISDFGREMNRQVYGAGANIIGQVSGSTSSSEFTVKALDSSSVDDGAAVDYYGTVNGDIAPGEYIYDGAVIGIGTAVADIGTVGTVTNRGKGIAAGTVTLSGTAGMVANDAVFLLDGSSGGTAGMNGVRDALSSTTGTSLYAGVARSTDGWAPQFGSASEALSLSRMESAYLNAKRYAQEGDKYAIFVNITLYKKYGDLLTAMRRTVNSTELVGGWTGLEFAAGAGQVGVFLDYDVPDGDVVVLNLDTWNLCQVNDMSWVEQGAENLLRLQNTITYQAALVWFANVICRAPAANARETQKTD
jgi:hypothetical protein